MVTRGVTWSGPRVLLAGTATSSSSLLLLLLEEQLVNVLHAANSALKLFCSLLSGMLLLLDQPDLVVDRVQLLLQHAGQGLGIRLPARTQQVGHHTLAVVRVPVDAAVIVPASVCVLHAVGL